MHATRGFTGLLVVALTGCGSLSAHPDPVPAVGPGPVLDAAADIPADFTVSTNEPSWQVEVSGDQVRLGGIDGTRLFKVEANQALFDGRNVTANDATGTLEVRVAARSCQDSMSGAWFPYTARVTIDASTPVLGCARGARDPLPQPR